MASETVTTTIRGVFDPEGNKPYNITTTGTPERLATFKAPIGEAAKALRGQLATLTYTTQQNEAKDGSGRVFTNYYLESVEPAQSLDQEIQQAGGVENILQGPSTIPLNPPGTPRGNSKTPEDRVEIRAAVALKAAVDLVPQLPEGDQRRSVVGSLQLAEKYETWLREAAKRNGGEDIFGAPQS